MNNCCYEVTSVLISIFILIYFGRAKKLNIYQNKVFLLIVILNVITACSDLIQYALICKGGFPVIFLYICSMCYFVSHILVVPLAFVYITSLAKSWYELRKLYKVFIIIPTILIEMMILSNPINGLLFYYDELGEYHRGPAVLALYITVAIYIVCGVLVLILKKRLYSVDKRLTIWACFIIVGIGMVIQAIDIYMRMESFSIAFSNLIITFLINNPIDMIDKDTNMYNGKAFNLIMQAAIARRKYTDIIIVTVMDYDDIVLLNYGEGDSIEVQQAEFLKGLWSGVRVFRTDKNVYILELTDGDDELIKQLVSSIEERFGKAWRVGNSAVTCKTRICNIAIPEEVNSLDQINAVIAEVANRKDYYKPLKIKDFDVKRLERCKKINNALVHAMDKDSFDIAFSPVYSIIDKRVVGVETTVRFLDNELGFVYEDEILEFAERTGQFYSLAEKLFAKVCDFIVSDEAEKAGIEFVGIKLSSVSCLQYGILSKYVEYVEKHLINPSKIVFLISEYMVSMFPDMIRESMETYRKKGFSFCLDEYGSGYTNIESIYSLPFDTVKMCRNVTRDACVNEKAAISMEGVMDTFRALEMKNTVDGITDEVELNKLGNLPCEYAMGRLFMENLDKARLFAVIEEFNEWKGGLVSGS